MEQRNTAIVVCRNAGFLPAACCQLLSTAQHLPGPDAARLFLVCCDVGEADLAEARRFFGARGIDVTLTVPDCAESIEPIETRWPRAAYLRLYFDVVFGPEFDRLVYFDADTRARRWPPCSRPSWPGSPSAVVGLAADSLRAPDQPESVRGRAAVSA